MLDALLINGRWTRGRGDCLLSTNPATEAHLWQGQSASSQDVYDAVEAALRVQDSWGRAPLSERVEILLRYQQKLQENEELLAQTIMQESGKALWDSRGEAKAMAAKVGLSLQAQEERSRKEDDALNQEVHRTVDYRPLGLCAVLGPFNFPGHLPNGQIVPALLAGNCVLFKPSEKTPKVGQLMSQLLHESGLPPGVFSYLPGGRETGEAILDQKALRALFFTGSAQTGKLIHRRLAGRPEVQLALEMGGNNPLIVDDSLPETEALYQIMQSAFVTAGQRCTCARRLLLPNSAYGRELLEALITSVKKLRIAAPDAVEQPYYGTVIDRASKDNLLNAQEKLLASGARTFLKMKSLDDGLPYLSPGILDMTQHSQIFDEEIFGPLLQVYFYDDFESAVSLANQTAYGLSAGLLSLDETKWQSFQQQIRAGVVNWNRPLTGASGASPFGGCGLSGNYHPGAYYTVDSCQWPMAGLQSSELLMPEPLPEGMIL